MRRGFAGITAFALLIACAHAQPLYRWVDKNGRVTYSQSPPPAGAAKSVQPKNLGSSVVETSTLPYAAQVAVKNFPVTLYASPDCGAPCDEGRASLQKRGIPFKEVSVTDQKGLDLLKSLSGKSQVPVIQIGSRTLSGYEAATWKNSLDEVGYPSSIASPQRAQTAPRPGNLPPVRLFTHSQCGEPCQEARAFLAARGVPFQETAASDDEALAEVRKFSPTGKVPVLIVGTTVLDTFTPARYESVIDAAGFPRPGRPAAR